MKGRTGCFGVQRAETFFGLPKNDQNKRAIDKWTTLRRLCLSSFLYNCCILDQRLSLSWTFYRPAVLRYKLTWRDTLEVSWKWLQRRRSGNPIRLPSSNAAAMWIRDARGFWPLEQLFVAAKCKGGVNSHCDGFQSHAYHLPLESNK